MFIINHRKLFFLIASLTVGLSLAAVLLFGLNTGIDFSGGSIVEVSYQAGERPNTQLLRERINDRFPGSVVQTAGEQNIIVKTAQFSDADKAELDLLLATETNLAITTERFKSIGPVISNELKNKSVFALILVGLTIIAFIAYVFRTVSQPVTSYKYGLVAIVALLHDILIPLGVFAVLGLFFVDYQIDVLFVTALLAILGFSVNDTIVVFDRIRENLRLALDTGKPVTKQAFENIVGISLNQTFLRSFNTSLTTLAVLLALIVFGSEATRPFAVVLAVGVIAGTYSSLFLASPLLVWLESKQDDAVIAERLAEEKKAAKRAADSDLPTDVQRFLDRKKS